MKKQSSDTLVAAKADCATKKQASRKKGQRAQSTKQKASSKQSKDAASKSNSARSSKRSQKSLSAGRAAATFSLSQKDNLSSKQAEEDSRLGDQIECDLEDVLNDLNQENQIDGGCCLAMGEEDSIGGNLSAMMPEESDALKIEDHNNTHAIGGETLAGYISDSVKVTPATLQRVMKNAQTDR